MRQNDNVINFHCDSVFLEPGGFSATLPTAEGKACEMDSEHFLELFLDAGQVPKPEEGMLKEDVPWAMTGTDQWSICVEVMPLLLNLMAHTDIWLSMSLKSSMGNTYRGIVFSMGHR